MLSKTHSYLYSTLNFAALANGVRRSDPEQTRSSQQASTDPDSIQQSPCKTGPGIAA